MSTRISLTILAVVAIIHSVPAWALGLGDARVQSFIGQPLELHIDLLTAPGDDMGSVSARLASAEDFALIGASREAISVPLNFQVRDGDARSGAFILVTSRLAVSSPVLRLVVEVNWSSGRLLREYTIFLDPPTVPSQAPAPIPTTPSPDSALLEDSTPSVSEPVPEPELTETAPQPASAVQEASTDITAPESESSTASASNRYGPIQDGETLWQIASAQLGDSGLDMNQVMVAIQRKNPNAFVSGNINLLKRGATLDLPTQTEMSELSSAQARELVAQQEAAFRMRSSLANSSTPLLASESVSDSADAFPRLGDPEESEVDEPDTGSEEDSVSRLQIVPASEEDLASEETGTGTVPGGEGSDEVDVSIREELARTEEALISVQQENDYLQDRIAELEAQLGDPDATSSGGLVADDELADLQERLESERQAGEDENIAAAESTDSEVPIVVTASDDESDRPWYSGPMTWIIMIAIVLAAVVGWIFNRRRSGEHYELDSEPLRTPVTGLKDEAEEILRTLDSDPEAEEATQAEDETPEPESSDDLDEPGEADSADEPEPAEAAQPRSSFKGDHGDATVLDENSSDPEIQLDLARAYISMGDKEAARSILDEVLNLGNEEQKAEAREMMDKI